MIDLGFLVEGGTDEAGVAELASADGTSPSLPEALMCGARLHRVNMDLLPVA